MLASGQSIKPQPNFFSLQCARLGVLKAATTQDRDHLPFFVRFHFEFFLPTCLERRASVFPSRDQATRAACLQRAEIIVRTRSIVDVHSRQRTFLMRQSDGCLPAQNQSASGDFDFKMLSDGSRLPLRGRYLNRIAIGNQSRWAHIGIERARLFCRLSLHWIFCKVNGQCVACQSIGRTLRMTSDDVDLVFKRCQHLGCIPTKSTRAAYLDRRRAGLLRLRFGRFAERICRQQRFRFEIQREVYILDQFNSFKSLHVGTRFCTVRFAIELELHL